MEELQEKHRLEQKDLLARTTQKKKAATKKNRKGVNDECAELERELKERQENELSALSTNHVSDLDGDGSINDNGFQEDVTDKHAEEVIEPLKTLTVAAPASDSHPKKQNRQKARLARRAAEQEAAVEQAQKEAADLPSLRDQERKSMCEAFISKGLKEHEIRSDGHCLYAAVADQLLDSRVGFAPKVKLDAPAPEQDTIPTSQKYKLIRQVAAAYISQNSDEFSPFLEVPLKEYVRTIKDTGEWGGHLEILALARAYEVDINILQGDGNVQKIECGLQNHTPEIWLAYYRHSFGLGEHYNSLRKVR